MQDTFDKYIMNTYYLKKEKLNFIINPDQNGYSKGTIFFDNDEVDIIENNNFIRVNLEFKDKILIVNITNVNNTKYLGEDNIIKRIEIWRISQIMSDNLINSENIILKFDLTTKKDNNIKAKLDKINNKLIIDFNENNIHLDLFSLERIYF